MKKIVSRQALITGIVGGLIYTGFSLGTYYTSINSFASFTFIYTWLPVILVLVIVSGFNVRKKLDGFISFKEGLQFALVTYLVYEIVVAITTYILFVVIDPLLTKKLLDAVMRFTTDFMKSVGTPQNKIDEAVANSKKQSASTGAGNVIQGIAWSLLWDFVKSLLAAWIIRKERPADLDFVPNSQPTL